MNVQGKSALCLSFDLCSQSACSFYSDTQWKLHLRKSVYYWKNDAYIKACQSDGVINLINKLLGKWRRDELRQYNTLKAHKIYTRHNHNHNSSPLKSDIVFIYIYCIP